MSASSKEPRRALIVVDVQNDYDGGNLAIQHPPFRDSVVNVVRAMDAAAATGSKVVVVKQMAPETSPIFAKGSHGGELHPEIARRGRDHYVEKMLPSAFTGTTVLPCSATRPCAGRTKFTLVQPGNSQSVSS